MLRDFFAYQDGSFSWNFTACIRILLLTDQELNANAHLKVMNEENLSPETELRVKLTLKMILQQAAANLVTSATETEYTRLLKSEEREIVQRAMHKIA